MEADTQAQVAVFLTGRRPSEYLDAVDGLDLRPALFAGYRELTPLRYDFPLVLGKEADRTGVQSLSPWPRRRAAPRPSASASTGCDWSRTSARWARPAPPGRSRPCGISPRTGSRRRWMTRSRTAASACARPSRRT